MRSDLLHYQYRIKTLSLNPAVNNDDAHSTWSDRADRLYLWTWSWLKNPSEKNHQLLVSVLEALDHWEGEDCFGFDDLMQIRCALGWILIFEPEKRNRWKKLLVRAGSQEVVSKSLYEFELLWIARTAARAQNRELDPDLLNSIERHPLLKQSNIDFSVPIDDEGDRRSDAGFLIDAEAGQIHFGNRIRSRSQATVSLLSGFSAGGDYVLPRRSR